MDIDRETLARNIAMAYGKTVAPRYSWDQIATEMGEQKGPISKFWLRVADLLIEMTDEPNMHKILESARTD